MEKNKPSDIYTPRFYSRNFEDKAKSAKIILGLLYQFYKPQSVVEFGCARGAWLAVAESLGAERLKGFDGEWVKQETLFSKNIDFTACNFEEAMPKLNEKFDLCICLEVAEHISEDKAQLFIQNLCESSNTVLFSAAIKYQGGANHINEKWQSYWIDLFALNDYECFDIFRGVLWNNDSVDFWFKQNMFLFVGPDNSLLNLNKLRDSQKPVFDIVHPTCYINKIKSSKKAGKKLTIRNYAGRFKQFIIKHLIKHSDIDS